MWRKYPKPFFNKTVRTLLNKEVVPYAYEGRQATSPQLLVQIQSCYGRCYQVSSNNHNVTLPKGNEDARDLAVAIVGSGPSGFYTAKYLQSGINKTTTTTSTSTATNDGEKSNHRWRRVTVDMIEKLPTPYGLVRSGVAPDHPEVKNVQNDFRALLDPPKSANNDAHVDADATAAVSFDIEFFGNVEVGNPNVVSLEELLSIYDVVVLAYGCESDRKLGIEGENLQGVLSAREFVFWYNGHPEYVHFTNELSKLLPDPTKAKIGVIGHGNVAFDCARILMKGGSGLKDTDIASHALPILKNGASQVSILGRRGHVQGAFTIKELRELTKLKKEGFGADFILNQEELDQSMTNATMEELNASRPKQRIDKLLRSTMSNSASSSTEEFSPEAEKSVSLRFLLNPIKFLPKRDNPNYVGSILCEKTILKGEPFKQRAEGTGEFEIIDVDMVLVSIGYKGIPIHGLEDAFDHQKGVVKNKNGKVQSQILSHQTGGSLYVCGWLKRGPSGIVGTNIDDAKDTVNTILSNLHNDIHSMPRKKGRPSLRQLLKERAINVVDWSSYQKINATETDPGRLRSLDQPREKITSIEEMLYIINNK